MPRITLILFIAILISNCSSLRKAGTVLNNTGNKEINTADIRKLNLTNKDFIIQKAEIEIDIANDSQSLTASLKYKTGGTYLLIIRSKTGIEAARFYITRDTILINDRVNRKLYCASPGYLYSKYGISVNALPVLFGDYLSENMSDNPPLICKNGLSELKAGILKTEINYTIDCSIDKVKSAKFGNVKDENFVFLSFDKFKKIDNSVFPVKIEMEDSYRKSVIRISIEKIDFSGFDKIDFIPGKNYEQVILK